MQERELDFTSRRLQGPLRRYVTLLLGFFVIAQILFLLVDFQFLNQLQQQASPQESAMTAAEIAGFLGMFNGALGVCELLMQWLAASRVIERLGVFATAMLMPGALAVISSFSTAIAVSGLTTSRILFFSLVILKFVDELLHYTLFAGISPVLFQPIPDTLRSNLQAMVRGVAEPLATGATGLSILGLVWVNHQFNPNGLGVTSLLVATVLLSLAWFMVIWFLRLQYVGLLVISAERGQLSVSDVDLKELKRAVVEALDRPGTDADKRSCIELLSHIDARNLGEVIAPLLHRLPPLLQRQGLEAMLNYPNPSHLEDVRSLLAQKLHPEVLAVALRYIWLTEANPDVGPLRSYLNPATDPVVRGTAASLMLRRGNPREKAEATETLRRMLTHERELERVKGCLALGEAVYLQSLRLHIDKLLQDESLRVRCALLEAIAATHLEEYYPSLIRGLRYKSTRAAAMRALERLENEAIPMLAQLASDPQTTDPVRSAALSTIGKIGTLEAKDALVNHLMTAWGNSRRIALRILLHLPREEGIDAVADNLGRSGIETLINQELLLIGQMYACLVDLSPDQISGMEAELLRRALHDMQSDAIQRLFLLMRFLYPSTAIKAAAFNLQADSQPENMARGLEILDNTVDLPSKRILLTVLDRRSDYEKLESLANLVPYAPLSPSQRLRELVELRHFLSDWALACCFHVARQAHWSLTAEQTLSCLRHSTGFVREAVLAYLRAASPRTLKDLLPRLSHDRDRLVLSQVKALMQEMGMDPAVAPPIARPKGAASRPERSGLETV